MEKDMVLFGAGKYGKEALRFYGKDRIAYFIDNNEKLQGTWIEGLEVHNLEEMKEELASFLVVVCANQYTSMVKQLLEMGIERFEIYTPEMTKALAKLSGLKFDADELLLFGVDSYTTQLVRYFESAGVTKDRIIIAERERKGFGGQSLDGVIVQDIEKIDTEKKVIVVSSLIYAYGIEQYKNRERIACKEWVNPFIFTGYYPGDQVVYNRYSEGKKEVTEADWNAERQKTEVFDGIEDYYWELSRQVPLFSHIEIETINRCNGRCSFCPVSAGNDIRPYARMEERLFYRIIDQLKQLNYKGRIALFSNNEPFLDERILDFHKYAREALPHARFHLFTNGTLLTLERFVALIDDLDELIIDNYNQSLQLNETSKVIRDYVSEHPELKTKVDIVIRKEKEILSTRGGQAPNRKEKKSYYGTKCTHPFRQMIVRPDGKVSLCCNDPYGKMTMGDAAKETLTDIWFGEAFSEVREKLQVGREAIELCRYCDFFSNR